MKRIALRTTGRLVLCVCVAACIIAGITACSGQGLRPFSYYRGFDAKRSDGRYDVSGRAAW